MPKDKHEPVRYLGIWLSEYGNKAYQKKTNQKHGNPGVEYLLTDTVLGTNEGEKLNSKLRTLFKHKCGLSKTMMDSVVYSQIGYNVFNILDRQTQMHSKELIHRINKQDIVGITTKVRLQQLQNRMWDPEEIYDKKVIGSMGNKQLKGNLTAQILKIMGDKGITLKKTKIEELPQAPEGGSYDLKSFMENREWYNRNRDSLRRKGVMFLEQLMNASLTQCIPWQQVKGRPSKGVQPKWYNEVVDEYNKRKKELRFQDEINPFNTLRKIGANEIKRFQTIVTKKESDLIYGLVSRNPKKRKKGTNNNDNNKPNGRREETPSLVIQHLIQETIKGEVRSPLIPCEGCKLKDTTPLRDSRILLKNEAKKCLIRTDINQIRSIPARQRIVSTTHKEDKRIKRRLLISPKSIRIYFKSTTNTGSIDQQEDTSVYGTHKNLLVQEGSTEKKINDLKAELSQYAQIVFYTDGSLLKNQEQGNQKEKRGEDRMGIGLAISPEGYDERILDFSARITGLASSSRAELWAILMALEIAPSNTKIKIYTDSASAIAAIKRFMVDNKRKKAKNLKNPNVLQAISDKCNGKRIIFELNKVEAHTGVFLNEKADSLAKEGANSNSWIKINPEFLQRRVNFEWENQSIDTDIKEFSKREQKINWYVNWRTQYKVIKWCNQNIAKETNWKLTQHYIHGTKISSKITDKEDNSNRTFNIKVLNDELPVLKNLHLRKPDVYSSDQCIICKKEKEDSLHPFVCQGYDNIIRNKLIQQLAIIGINQGSKKKKTELVAALQKESFMKIDVGRKLRGIVESDHFSLIDMIRGLVYKHMQNKIKTIIIADTNKVKEIQKQILSFLRLIMKKQWEERCKLFLKWEKENEISGSNKRKYKTGKKSKGYDNIIRNKLIQQLAIIGINQGSKKKKTELVAALQKESFMKIDVGRKLRGIVESDHFSLIDMIRGLVYKHMQNKIKTIIIADTNKVKEIQKQILSFLRLIMKKQWEERCKLFLKWEKENEISGSNKRKYKTGKKSKTTVGL
ncbi:hypothetical protein Glove_502g39 [Diversispora epigaea]|uniref:ribonuclease H n=1 Tax=Diversispora epigaea TaxID=1348612 RepID=A0A397GMN0_9GLOM|nr:hypothetical protein Glove_502g39 [Diversispora epigaea]